MFAVSRSCAPSAATSQKIRLYSTKVRPSARPAAIHAHIPAMEIAFGDTFRAASQAVADCAHFRFRVAIGRRSLSPLIRSSRTESITGLISDDQITLGGRRVF